ncbi:MAG: SAM hydrolase/SAM-dependent halogenase family protein [Gaiellaceae bacterium]
MEQTMRFRFITFLTDFGLQDDFVGTCHGVIKSIAPDVGIIDITHGIEPRRVLQGALTLADTIPYMPLGVHLTVVDPGVGTDRRAIALEDKSGRFYVGPDNGLLLPAAERMGGLVRAHQITNRAYAMKEIAPTFNGRDLFSPAAAHLALGVPIEDFGPALDLTELVRLDIPKPESRRGRIKAVVVDTDRFGNMQLNIRNEHLEALGLSVGTRVELEHGGERYYAITARTFSDARRGDIMLYEDSFQNLAVAISGGDAANMFGAAPGDRINIRLRED